jgi:hypothetical protein
MRPRLLLALAALLSSVALAAAGCGGGDEEGEAGSGAAPAGAAIAPASVSVFVSVNTDSESAQWQAAEALLDRFPAGEELIAQVTSGLGEEGKDWETDIKPALGSETDLLVFGGTAEDPELVLLTQPADPAKLDALFAGADEPPVTAEVDGWTAVASNQAALDAFQSGRSAGVLADAEGYQAATAELEPEALVTVFVSGTGLGRLAQSLQESAAAGDAGLDLGGILGIAPTGQLGSLSAGLDWFAGSLSAAEDGVHFEGVAAGEQAGAGASFEPQLLSQMPAGALVYAGFGDLREGFNQILDQLGEQSPEVDQALGQLELGLGISVREDIPALTAGEGAFALYPGLPIPEVTLVLTPEDAQRAYALAGTLVQRVSLFTGGEGPATSEVDVDGVTATEIQLQQGISIYVAAVGERLVVSTSKHGITGLSEAGEKLAGDPAFTAAQDAAEMPSSTSGFVYADVGKLADLFAGLASLGGAEVPPEAAENLGHLGSALLWTSTEDGRARFAGFLAIQ